MNPYDLALENLSLRVERDTGHPLTFKTGVQEDGTGWCESFHRGVSIDKTWHCDGIDAARRMLFEQPIQRAAYGVPRYVRGYNCWFVPEGLLVEIRPGFLKLNPRLP